MKRNPDMIWITKVRHLSGFKLRIEFTDGAAFDVDLKDQLWGEMFEPLKKVKYFKKVRVRPELGSIAWPNEADFSPEVLYQLGQMQKKKKTKTIARLGRKTSKMKSRAR